jgi:hypothetical protein
MRNPVTHSRMVAIGLGLALAALPLLAFAQTDTSGSGAGLFGGLFGCICGLIGLAIEVFILYWVYTDAKKRGNPNAILWVVVTFFLGLIGLILYVLIGRNQGTSMGGPPPTGPVAPGGPSNTVRY